MNPVPRVLVLAIALSLASHSAVLAEAPPAASTSSARLAEEFRSGVYALADDSMEGRGINTRGIHRAADWIERRLRADGFQPAFGTSYRQPFDIKTMQIPVWLE